MGQCPDLLISESIYLLKKQNITEFVIDGFPVGAYCRYAIKDLIKIAALKINDIW